MVLLFCFYFAFGFLEFLSFAKVTRVPSLLEFAMGMLMGCLIVGMIDCCFDVC